MSASTVDAAACGALGCTTTEDLRRVTVDDVTRTLCPNCAKRFREVKA
jgi:hypothetical protein